MLSGGNFHGAPLAYAFDYAAIAMTDLAGITERRIDRLLNPDINEGLPAFLSPDPGLSSGFMIAQIVAAALINECQVLSHPSSTGSIPTDGGKEDHVSMGMTGALKLRQIVENVERIVAIELMCAAQAIEFRRPLQSSPPLERVHDAVRAVVPRLEQDRVLATDIDAIAAAVRAGAFNAWSDRVEFPACIDSQSREIRPQPATIPVRNCSMRGQAGGMTHVKLYRTATGVLLKRTGISTASAR